MAGSKVDFGDVHGLTTGDWTTEAWFLRLGSGSHTYGGVMGKYGGSGGQGADGQGWLMGTSVSGADAEVATQYSAGNYDVLAAAGVFPVGKWRHYVVTKEGTTGTVYVDGAVMTSGTLRSPWAVATPMVVGAYSNGNGVENGVIAHPAIYSRALSRGEILEHWQYGLSR